MKKNGKAILIMLLIHSNLTDVKSSYSLHKGITPLLPLHSLFTPSSLPRRPPFTPSSFRLYSLITPPSRGQYVPITF